MTLTPEQLDILRQAALRVAGRLVGADQAEDVAQEVLLRALATTTDITTYVGPWAVRVATNVSLDLLRVQGRAKSGTLPERSARAVDSDLQMDLRAALDALPERQRQVIALRQLSDLDERATARLLGISPGAVKRHLHRAKAGLRKSPHLIHHEPALETKEFPVHDWTTRFTRAVEPDGGWPQRPWDHWRLESRAGRVARVAVVDGEPVLDAQGDEVMSGPGFNYEVVKVLPAVADDEPTPVNPEFERRHGLLGDLLDEALEVAHQFGHIWVGDEHLAVVLAARRIAGMPDLEVLERGIATFYEGPFAEQRLALVHARKLDGDYPRDPVPKTFTLPIQDLMKSDGLSAEQIATQILEPEHRLVRHLLS